MPTATFARAFDLHQFFTYNILLAEGRRVVAALILDQVPQNVR